MADYIADVKKYDATASEEVVGKIVKHLGVALRRRDSSVVSCSDPKELERVKKSWCGKKLGVRDDAKVDRILELVCQTMAADNSKSRVTFYYLTAKHLEKLAEL
ncbi:MAG: DUF2853 family protein [Rhizobiaceae bacterium]|jgi:hypothetical protein